MNLKDLKPIGSLAQIYGVKILAYGQAGVGKTPLIATCPNPVVLAVETGMLSMRGNNAIPAYQADTVEKIEDFFKWLFQSKEAQQFDTVCIDSISQVSKMYLDKELPKHKDDRQAYREVHRKVMNIANGLYYMQNKHVYMIAQQDIVEIDKVNTVCPLFVGKAIRNDVSHLYDEILHIGKVPMQGYPQGVNAIRCAATFGIMARDRSMKLNDIEPMDIGNIINKCIS